MNREEIERLCNTSEIEFVQPKAVISRNVKNKCGNIIRDGVTYPDIVELLTIDEIKRYSYGRQSTPQMLKNFFPGFNDIFFVQTHQRGIRQPNGQYVERTVGFGMYYSRNNYTIEEDDNYFYVSTCYDLYLDNRIMDSDQNIVRRLMRSDNLNEVPGSLRSQAPVTEHLDRVGQRICERSCTQVDGSMPVRTNRRLGGYYPAEREEIRQHMLQNILPGMKEHLTNADRTEIDFVPDALRACTAFSKDSFYLRELGQEEPNNWIEYDWLMRGELQRKMQELEIGTSNWPFAAADERFSNDIDGAQAIVLMDGGHHKKHEYMITKVRPSGWNHPIYAQLLCTSKTAGNLKEMLAESINNGISDHNDHRSIYNIEPKNLMSEQANLGYYEEETRASLDRLVGRDLTLVRTGSADGYKSPKGNTLQDICQFNGDLYTAIVDRPMRLRRGDLSIDLGEGLYVVCVDHGTELDFLQYTRVTDYFSDVRIEEVHSRLTIDQEVYRAAVVEVHEGRDLVLDQGEKAEKHLSSYRIARGDLDLGDH